MPLNTAVLAYETTENGPLPALYDAMCRAIDAAFEVDEVKDIRDKARALEVYARQAQNFEAEHRAVTIRLRSERKAGELLQAKEKAKGAIEPGTNRGVTRSHHVTASPTLRELGISKRQSSDWQKLAAIPDDQFEAALLTEAKPSTAGIIAATTPPKPEVVPVSREALWLWGRLGEFERDYLQLDPTEVPLTLTPRMLDDVHRLAPQVAKWLAQIGRTT